MHEMSGSHIVQLTAVEMPLSSPYLVSEITKQVVTIYLFPKLPLQVKRMSISSTNPDYMCINKDDPSHQTF